MWSGMSGLRSSGMSSPKLRGRSWGHAGGYQFVEYEGPLSPFLFYYTSIIPYKKSNDVT